MEICFLSSNHLTSPVPIGSKHQIHPNSNAITMLSTRIPFSSQFQFFISCIIVLILRAEYIFSITDDSTASTSVPSSWLAFLTILANGANKVTQSQTIGASIQNDNIKVLVSHFSRFRELKSQQLLAVLTQDDI